MSGSVTSVVRGLLVCAGALGAGSGGGASGTGVAGAVVSGAGAGAGVVVPVAGAGVLESVAGALESVGAGTGAGVDASGAGAGAGVVASGAAAGAASGVGAVDGTGAVASLLIESLIAILLLSITEPVLPSVRSSRAESSGYFVFHAPTSFASGFVSITAKSFVSVLSSVARISSIAWSGPIA